MQFPDFCTTFQRLSLRPIAKKSNLKDLLESDREVGGNGSNKCKKGNYFSVAKEFMKIGISEFKFHQSKNSCFERFQSFEMVIHSLSSCTGVLF